MILTCSACSTRFLVDPALLGAEGRMVRCAKCGHQWKQALPEDVAKDSAESPAEEITAPPLETGPRTIPAGAELPSFPQKSTRRNTAIGWVVLAVVVIGVLGGGTIARDQIVALWPPAAKLYETVGLAVEPVPFDLALRNVKHSQRTEDGVPVLIIEGEVKNNSKYAYSMSGHTLPALANEDCAMWRALQARPICRDADVPATMVAAAPGPEESEVLAMVLGVAPAAGGSMASETATTEPHDEFEATAAALAATLVADESQVAEAMVTAAPEPDGSEVPEMVLGVAPAAGGPMAPETAKAETPAVTALAANRPTATWATKPEPLAATTETPATTAAPADRGTAAKPVQLATLAARLPEREAKPKPGRFVVLGSYLKEANARDAMKRGHDFAPRMVRVRVHGRLFHRVVSGPYAPDSVGTIRRILITEGFRDAWTATLCQNTLRRAPCRTAPARLNVSTNSPAS